MQSNEKKRLASFIADSPFGPAAAAPAHVNASNANTIVQPENIFSLIKKEAIQGPDSKARNPGSGSDFR